MKFKSEVKKWYLLGEVNNLTKYSIVNQALKDSSSRNQVLSVSDETSSFVEFVVLPWIFFDFREGIVSTIEAVIASTITVTEKMARQDAALEVSG